MMLQRDAAQAHRINMQEQRLEKKIALRQMRWGVNAAQNVRKIKDVYIQYQWVTF